MAEITKNKPKITLYEHVNFKGRSVTFTEANDNLIDAGFNDYSSSVIVEGGVWVLYQHCNYTGDVCVVMEGDRTNLLSCNGDKDTKIHDFNEVVSSLKPWNFDFSEEPKCTVYVADFKGRSLQFTEDIRDLGWYKMSNQISSIRVHSGAWVGYDMANFRGRHSLYLPGDHLMSSTAGGFRNDKLCSLRALQIKETHPVIVDEIEFHINRGEHHPKLRNVFSWTQKNDTSVPQNLSISKEKTITTENYYELKLDAGASVSFDISGEVSAELNESYNSIGTAKASRKYNLGMKAHVGVAQIRNRKTIKTEKWNVVYPTEIPSKSKITLTSSLTRSKVNVPYTVTFHQGKKKWTETGTYYGVDHHGFVTEFKEEPL
ncbi:CRYB [Mytilus coruscus]|uniref:CRYB n=1 Tax=Mytilus coruscus TaxID=42192 RepID=A0A6J8EZU7_MYTCO|nr:CRYB [Mytilus coruscus]